jgi:hypothetical protein
MRYRGSFMARRDSGALAEGSVESARGSRDPVTMSSARPRAQGTRQ